MMILARLIGLAVLLIGVTVMINPVTMRNMLNFWSKGKRIYTAAVLRIIFAVVFFLVASHSRIPMVSFAAGLLFLVGGVTIFSLGEKKAKAILDRWKERGLKSYRLISVIPAIIGMAVLYSL